MKINYAVLRQVCSMKEKEFEIYGETVTTTRGTYVYIDNGADVLGIAHRDSVEDSFHFSVYKVNDIQWVFNPQLDDRLGVFTMLDMLPKMGIKIDVLLTTGEEKGQTTGNLFKPEKKYNWMFEFDRMKGDVVHYQYGSGKLKKALNKAGFKDIGTGSASDISQMDHLGCEGFNVGCGYEDYHGVWARANMHTYINQLSKFNRFYSKYKDIHFPYTKPAYLPVKHSTPTPSTQTAGGWRHEKKWNPYGYSSEEWEGNPPVDEKNTCIDCGCPVEISALYDNVCIRHQTFYRECVLCDSVVEHRKMVTDMCPQCHYQYSNSISIYTQIKCKVCNRRIMTEELDGQWWGTCVFCKEKLKAVVG